MASSFRSSKLPSPSGGGVDGEGSESMFSYPTWSPNKVEKYPLSQEHINKSRCAVPKDWTGSYSAEVSLQRQVNSHSGWWEWREHWAKAVSGVPPLQHSQQAKVCKALHRRLISTNEIGLLAAAMVLGIRISRCVGCPLELVTPQLQPSKWPLVSAGAAPDLATVNGLVGWVQVALPGPIHLAAKGTLRRPSVVD